MDFSDARNHAINYVHWGLNRGRRWAQRPYSSIKLATNVFLEWDKNLPPYDATYFWVRLHNTRVITFYPDRYVLRVGKFFGRFTLLVINRYVPEQVLLFGYRIKNLPWNDNTLAVIRTPKGLYPFHDGAELSYDGDYLRDVRHAANAPPSKISLEWLSQLTSQAKGVYERCLRGSVTPQDSRYMEGLLNRLAHDNSENVLVSTQLDLLAREGPGSLALWGNPTRKGKKTALAAADLTLKHGIAEGVFLSRHEVWRVVRPYLIDILLAEQNLETIEPYRGKLGEPGA